jgi:DNA-binding NarL/FixJ family response regulator
MLAALGQPTRAASIWGASEALRAANDVVIPAAERGLYDQMVALGRDRLDPAAFAAAWHAGREMSLDQALELARAEPSREPVASLTQREQEIASLVARGLTNRQIADTLGVAPRTADTHVSNILRKLGLTSRTDLQRDT